MNEQELDSEIRKLTMNTCCEHNHGTFTEDRDCRVRQIKSLCFQWVLEQIEELNKQTIEVTDVFGEKNNIHYPEDHVHIGDIRKILKGDL